MISCAIDMIATGPATLLFGSRPYRAMTIMNATDNMAAITGSHHARTDEWRAITARTTIQKRKNFVPDYLEPLLESGKARRQGAETFVVSD